MNVRAFRLRPIAEFLRASAASRLGWGALASIPGLAFAGPTGESVVAGGAAISRPDATHTQIDQSTQSAVINWSTFSVDSDEFVVFNQPGATASVLNRVIGSQQSNILGQINANGRVFLVNPQGVYFAPGAKVDVGALTASVLDITNEDFMSGSYVFRRSPGAPDGVGVENAGEIKVGDGGYVVLAGDYANNTGVISARLGTVVLAAGSQMTMDLSDDGLVSFAVDEATVSGLAGVNNSGEIVADGGQVIMTAKVANDLVATAVNNDGLLQAHRIVEDGGEIYLSASGGDIVNAGTIDVAGASGQSGGEVSVLGDEDITLTAGSQINANGDGAGNGGVITVIADGKMAFRHDAEVTAVAGTSGERGGNIELSGNAVSVRGNIKVGNGGVLIDPRFAEINTTGVGGPSTIGVDKAVIESVLAYGGLFSLSASESISKTAAVTSITGAGSLRFFISDLDGDINLAGLEINIGGDFSVTAGVNIGDVNLGKITNADDVFLHAGALSGDITLNTGGIAAASNNLVLSAPGGNITVGTPALPGDVTLDGFSPLIDVDALGNFTVFGDVITTGSGSDTTLSINAQNVFANDLVAYAASGGNGTLNVNVGNDILIDDAIAGVGGSGSYGGGAFLNMFAARDFIGNDVEAYGETAAGVVVSVGRDFVFNELAAEVGTTISPGTGDASLNATAGRNGTIGALVVTGDGDATATVLVTGDLTVNTGDYQAGTGDAFGSLRFGNNGRFGRHTATAAGSAFIGFGEPTATSGNTALFTNAVVANGGTNDSIGVGVRNSIRTVGDGILAADNVFLRVSNTGTTLIDVKTRTPALLLQNTGLTPDVVIDNRAFIGPSAVNFSPGITTLLRSASFFATGPLAFNGGAFSAHRLAVAVTNGTATFNNSVFITGNNPFPVTPTDAALFTLMGNRGLTPPGHGPNVQIFAQNGINITNPFVVGGPSPFTKMFSNGPFMISGLTTTASNITTVFSPIDTTRPVFFEDVPFLQPPGASAFFNFPTISGLPNNDGTTVVFGEIGPGAVPVLSGPLTVGANGSIDIGDRNMFIITRGAVNGGADLVSTNSIFEIIGLAAANFFQIPIVNEFGDEVDNENEQEDDDLALVDEDDGGGNDGEVSQEAGGESLECS